MIETLKLEQGNCILDLRIIRSKRRSISLEIRSADDIRVRIPDKLSDQELGRFIDDHKEWIFEKTDLAENQVKNRKSTNAKPWEELSTGEQRMIKEKFISRVLYFSEIMEVSVGKITIRNQKTRWGSCSSKGNLNFNYQLYYLPDELLDYVVVHELSHRRHMNHSREFWMEVERYCPEYRTLRNTLRQYILAYRP